MGQATHLAVHQQQVEGGAPSVVLQEQAAESVQDLGVQGPILRAQQAGGVVARAKSDLALWSYKTPVLLRFLLFSLPPQGLWL